MQHYRLENSPTANLKTAVVVTDAGFTLIELLVVVAIISSLTAIAVPFYEDYKSRAFDLRARIDLRNVATAEEAYFLDYESYLSCRQDDCTKLPGIAALSKGVTLAIEATASGFTGTSSHPRGSGKIFRWDSSSGGLSDD